MFTTKHILATIQNNKMYCTVSILEELQLLTIIERETFSRKVRRVAFRTCLHQGVFTRYQGCPIVIPKNPEISSSSRKVHSARPKYVKSGGGVVAELSTHKSVDSSKKMFFFA